MTYRVIPGDMMVQQGSYPPDEFDAVLRQMLEPEQGLRDASAVAFDLDYRFIETLLSPFDFRFVSDVLVGLQVVAQE